MFTTSRGCEFADTQRKPFDQLQQSWRADQSQQTGLHGMGAFKSLFLKDAEIGFAEIKWE